MENEKLKNCPVCNEYEIQSNERYYEGVFDHYEVEYSAIECNSCGISVE